MLVHPIRVGIIEALLHIDRPLSPANLTNIFDLQYEGSLIAYHVRSLKEQGIVIAARRRKAGNLTETFYVLK